MSVEKFIKNKLSILEKDNKKGFTELRSSFEEMADSGVGKKVVQVPADGNWFKLSFEAVEIKQDHLIISAQRIKSGVFPSTYDPSEKQYFVEFNGTRAAYLRGFYKARHSVGGWPYVSWDIRAYANHPVDQEKRVYVHDFRAHDEIRKMIVAMERAHGTSNIVNVYINDNLQRFQAGIRSRKTPQEIEKSWSKGMMESLGYSYVEANDTGLPKGKWGGVTVHWCKHQADLLSVKS